MEFKRMTIKSDEVGEVIDLLSFFRWNLLENKEIGRNNQLVFNRDKMIDNYQEIIILENIYFNTPNNTTKSNIIISGILIMLVLMILVLSLIFPVRLLRHLLFMMTLLSAIFITTIIIKSSSNTKFKMKDYELDLMKINILTEVLKLH